MASVIGNPSSFWLLVKYRTRVTMCHSREITPMTRARSTVGLLKQENIKTRAPRWRKVVEK